MKWTTWILFAAAMAVLLALAAMVTRQRGRTTVELFANIELRLADKSYDQEQVLSDLDLALAEARAAHDAGLAARILLTRGKLLMQIGAFERARADLQTVYAERNGELAIGDLLVELATRAGDYRAGLARVKEELDRDPSYGRGWAQCGKLHRRAAEKTVAQCTALVERALVPEDAQMARAWIERSSALDPLDPERVAMSHRLRTLLGSDDEGLIEEVLKSCDAASRETREARTALARSLALAFDVEAFTSLLELFARAGHREESLLLGQCGERIQAVRESLPTAAFLVRELARDGRFRSAAQVAQPWLNRKLPASAQFFLDCCRALYSAQRFDPLRVAADELFNVGNPAEQKMAGFYTGIAGIAQAEAVPENSPDPKAGEMRHEALVGGRFALQRYLDVKSSEPFAGANAVAWRARARASRLLGEPAAEREALEAAVEIEPDHDGALWLRLCELQIASPHGGYRVPELRWAKGMSLLPLRTEELMPRWHEIGGLALKSAGIEVESQRQIAVAFRLWTPAPDAGPYELYRLALLSLEADDPGRAALATKKLLEIVPGFVPGIDVAIEAARGEKRQHDVIDLLVKRLQAVGSDEKSSQGLRSIPGLAFEPEDRLALMRADPERFGREMIARTLAARGEKERALSILLQLGADSLGEDGRKLAAELSLALARPKEALELIVPLGRKRVVSWMPALHLFVSAALAAHDVERLTAFITAMSQGAQVGEGSKKDWLALADRLLASGEPKVAELLLTRLDEEAETRGGDVLVRLCAAALAEGDAPRLAAAIERTQAFDTHGSLAFLEVLNRVREGRFDDLSPAIAELRESGFKLNALQAALLDLLEMHFEAVEEPARLALENEKDAPLWHLCVAAATIEAQQIWAPPPFFGAQAAKETRFFLRGRAEEHDVRLALAVVFAMPSPLGAGWARAQVRAMTPASFGTLWPAFLEASLLRSIDDVAGARAALERLLAEHSDFGPAWDALERWLPADEDIDARALVELRMRRAQALVDLSGTRPQRQLDTARILDLRGDREGALKAARKAVELNPASGPIQWKLARLCARGGRIREAFEAYATAVRLLRPGADLLCANEILDLVPTALRADPPAITSEEAFQALVILVQKLPHHPRIALSIARLDLASDPQNPALGVARASLRLTRFREAHKKDSLESLAPGSTADWAGFYLSIDPDRAEEFLKKELALDPGSLEPWLLLGRVYDAQGRTREAVDQFQLVLRLAPSGAVQREYLRLMARRELTLEEIEKLVKDVVESAGLDQRDAEIALLRGQALLNSSTGRLPAAIRAFEEAEQEPAPAPAFREKHGFLSSFALLARGTKDDLERASTLLSGIRPLVTDPYAKDLLEALAGLARLPVN